MPKSSRSQSKPNWTTVVIATLLILGLLSYFTNTKENIEKQEMERVEVEQKTAAEETSLDKITEDVDSEEFTEMDREMARFAEEVEK